MGSLFTAGQLAAARREAQAEAATRPAKGEMPGGDGRLEMRVPLKAYLQAVSPKENGGHGESPQDEAYWADMARIYPECHVRHASRKFSICFRNGRFGGTGFDDEPKRRNRFGKVSFHKAYPRK